MLVGPKTQLVLERATTSSDGMSTKGTKTWKKVKVYTGVLFVDRSEGQAPEKKYSTSNRLSYSVYYDPYVEISIADRFINEKTQVIYLITDINNLFQQGNILTIGLQEK